MTHKCPGIVKKVKPQFTIFNFRFKNISKLYLFCTDQDFICILRNDLCLLLWFNHCSLLISFDNFLVNKLRPIKDMIREDTNLDFILKSEHYQSVLNFTRNPVIAIVLRYFNLRNWFKSWPFLQFVLFFNVCLLSHAYQPRTIFSPDLIE